MLQLLLLAMKLLFPLLALPPLLLLLDQHCRVHWIACRNRLPDVKMAGSSGRCA